MPFSSMSALKNSPYESLPTQPTKLAIPPKLAIPLSVFATEPPDVIVRGEFLK
jgi:hypothetical protein